MLELRLVFPFDRSVHTTEPDLNKPNKRISLHDSRPLVAKLKTRPFTSISSRSRAILVQHAAPASIHRPGSKESRPSTTARCSFAMRSSLGARPFTRRCRSSTRAAASSCSRARSGGEPACASQGARRRGHGRTSAATRSQLFEDGNPSI